MEKPPLGLVPIKIRQEQRLNEIRQAIIRYLDCPYPIPVEWIEEYNFLVRELGG